MTKLAWILPAAMLALCSTVVLCSTVALADETDKKDKKSDKKSAKLFEQLDANSDGQVTSDEAPQERRKLFDRLVRKADKDGDGKLSKEEFAAGLAAGKSEDAPAEERPERPQGGRGGPLERIREMDANGDGKVGLDEVPEQFQGMFENLLDQFDDDEDDALSMQEIAKALPALRERFQRRRGGEGAPDRGARGSMPGPGPLFSALDANGDGQVDSQEMAGAAEALKKLDRDGDGSLSADELRGGRGRASLQARAGRAARTPDLSKMVDRAMAADKDGDGKISKEEAPERMRERFDRIDKNGDGFVDRSELEDRMSKAAAKGKGKGKGDKGKKKLKPAAADGV